jgi:hypothetical protein
MNMGTASRTVAATQMNATRRARIRYVFWDELMVLVTAELYISAVADLQESGKWALVLVKVVVLVCFCVCVLFV